MTQTKTSVEELIKENKELLAEVSALRKHLKDLTPVVASINAKSLNGGNLFSDWLKSGPQVEFNCGSVPEYLFLSGWYSHKKSVSEKSL